MITQEQFEKAVAESKQLTQRPSNDVLLQLYSLYKQATDGDAGEDTSSMFDFVAKAKYNAWASLKGKSKEEAMQQYVSIVENLKQQ
jgi:diazepam-binding inhibitor (GABA receptor modulator, acyl-CoA-binding protein)